MVVLKKRLVHGGFEGVELGENRGVIERKQLCCPDADDSFGWVDPVAGVC